MLSYDNAAAIAAAPTTASLDPRLQQLIADRVHDWTVTSLLELTHLLIVQAEDSEKDIVEEIAFSPLENPLDGNRFGSSGFVPPFDWLQRHDGWFELIQTVSNSGFAFVLFIEDADGADPSLQALCRAYAEQPPGDAPGEHP